MNEVSMQHYVVGIDPSLTQTGLAICPLDWGGDWSRVRLASFPTTPFGKGPGDRMRRCATVVDRVMLALAEAGGLDVFEGTHFFIEDYAYSMATRAHHIGELGGEFRRRLPITAEVGIGAARKRLLGKAPRDGAKVRVFEAMTSAGGKFSTLDEAEAMCICNYGLGELGGFNFTGPA